MSGWFNIAGVLITMDIEKSSDSLGYSVTILVLKKFGFGENVGEPGKPGEKFYLKIINHMS